MAARHPKLFALSADLPEGFSYRPDFLSAAEEQDLAPCLAGLPFRQFEFRGYLGKRRVVSFGWSYDFNKGALSPAGDIPGFLLPVRDRAAAFAGRRPAELQHALVTEYAAGTEIGWHRDRPEFGEVVGISLLSPCTFRFRRRRGSTWQRASLTAEPRSAYLLQGPARTEWQHSIPAVGALRYSITFRTVRAEARAPPG
jgi:alkylated DNA repair dioxygenase AlkB